MNSINDIKCDRCGQPADFAYGKGGNCLECGDDLCISCAGNWHDDDGICDQCFNANMTTQEFQRPEARLSGTANNDIVRYYLASRTLKKHGYHSKVSEMLKRILKAKSTAEAIAIIDEYVVFVKQ